MRCSAAIAICVLACWIVASAVGAASDVEMRAAPEREAPDWPTFPDPNAAPIPIDELPVVDLEATGFSPVAAFTILEHEIAPGTRTTIDLELSESFTGGVVETPVQVIHGSEVGPVLCLMAGLHGDEVVGIEVVRRVVARVEPTGLHGTIVAVPVANPVGFKRLSRYLPDRRDLNRHFPGRSYGSSASRIAHRLFEGVVRQCDLLVDFHSGSFHRANLPQVRTDLGNPILFAIAGWFGAPVVIDNAGSPGTLRYAAVAEGIDALLYEAGEPMRFDEPSVRTGVAGVLSLMRSMQMAELGEKEATATSEYFRGSHWVRSDFGGIFLGEADLGAWVKAGERLGTVTSPFTNESRVVLARAEGRVIGRAVDQVVTPGYALFHVGTVEDGELGDEEPVADDVSEPPGSDERPE